MGQVDIGDWVFPPKMLSLPACLLSCARGEKIFELIMKYDETAAIVCRAKMYLAVGRIRTYAPRGNLISSQTP